MKKNNDKIIQQKFDIWNGQDPEKLFFMCYYCKLNNKKSIIMGKNNFEKQHFNSCIKTGEHPTFRYFNEKELLEYLKTGIDTLEIH